MRCMCTLQLFFISVRSAFHHFNSIIPKCLLQFILSHYDFANKKNANIVYTLSSEKRRRKANSGSEYHTFPEKFHGKWKLRRKLAIAKSKWNGMKKNKRTKVQIYIDWWHSSVFCKVLFPILSNRIDSISCVHLCWPMHISLFALHLPALSLWQYCFSLSQISAPHYWFILFIACLLLIFRAWNNQIIRPKCLLSQMSSLNQ